jgi:HEAT repeat protein
MKLGLPLKLAIGIVVVFGLLLAGMALYMPFWYRYQLYQLRSDDPGKRTAAAKAVAARGKAAMPYIKEWLKSEGDKTFTGACLVLEKMEGDTWRQAVNEIDRILNGSQSKKTDAAARLVYKKRYILPICHTGFSWKHYSEQPNARRNICIYIISQEENDIVRQCAIGALIDIRNSSVMELLIETIKNDSDMIVRITVACVFGVIGDPIAVEALIYALEHDRSHSVRWHAACALAEINDARAIEPLITILRNNPDSYVRNNIAIALAGFDDKRIDSVLEATRNNKDAAAVIALAWRNGGVDLELANMLELDYKDGSVNYLCVFLDDAKARWGNASAIESLLPEIAGSSLLLRRFHVDVFSRVCDGFVGFYKKNIEAQVKQARAIEAWYKKNKHRLAWDAKKRKYFLRGKE